MMEERFKSLLNYCQDFSLGGANSSEILNGIIEGAVEGLQRKVGMENVGQFIFKFMVECSDPRNYPRSYKGLLYYNKENLPKLIESASYEEENDDLFGYEPAKIATENEIKRNYKSDLRKFIYDYGQFKNQNVPIYDIYTSFTSNPNKINVGYFLIKDVCHRVLVSHATNKNIFINNRSGLEEYEVFDIVTKDSFVEILSFDNWLSKYPDYSIGFRNYLEKHSRSAILPITALSDFTEEEIEIRNIMNKVIEESL